jgi:hypothetical protein
MEGASSVPVCFGGACDHGSEERSSGVPGREVHDLRSHRGSRAAQAEHGEDGHLSEPDFPDHPVLVYVTNPGPAALAALTGLWQLDRLRLDEVN